MAGVFLRGEKLLQLFRWLNLRDRLSESSRVGGFLDHRTNNSKQPHGFLSNLIQHSRSARMFYSNSWQVRSGRCNTHAAHPRGRSIDDKSPLERENESRFWILWSVVFTAFFFLFFPSFSQVSSSVTIDPSSSSFLFFLFLFSCVTFRYNSYKRCESYKYIRKYYSIKI